MAYETENLRKLREECHIQWPLHVNPHNHFIEDRIGVVIASVAGGGERIAPYLAAAAAAMGEQIIRALLLSRAGEWELSTTKIWVIPCDFNKRRGNVCIPG